ncbi:MAG TPA: hypothetical protein VE338_00225 [Ktedonobacterales bacterium]|nr:hypothetical protein [Ktedonobacterales bacterium]
MTAIVLLGLFTTGCASASMGSARQTAAIATSTPTAPLTNEGRLALRVRQAEGAAAKSITLAYHQATSTVDVTVTLGWTPIWKTEFAKAQTAAKLACYEAQAALWTSGIALNKVTVTVLGQALDDYGQIITGAYAVATMTSAHASATQWTSTSPDTAWSLYDEVFLRPLYGSDWMYPHPTTPPAS